MAPRSPAASMVARMSETRPGAGSSTSVRSWCKALSSLRYCTISAWHRKQCSTWSRTAMSANSEPSAMRASTGTTSSHRMCGLLSTQREQLLPQLAPRPVQPDLGGRLGDAELLGDRLVGKVVDIAQDDDRPQLRRQLLEGIIHPAAQQAGLGHGDRVDVGMRVGERHVL